MMKPEITIIGAGMAGLLAGNMLRNYNPIILEKQRELPNNHNALLRFRNQRVSDQLRIPFRKVKVFKGIVNSVNPIFDAMQYSHKVTSRYEMRSIIDTAPVERFIAPLDLIQRMAANLNIRFDQDALFPMVPWHDPNDLSNPPHPLKPTVISTMPMETLMNILDYPGARPKFYFRNGSVITAKIHKCDVFATLYSPLDNGSWYRASITGDRLMIEFAFQIIDEVDEIVDFTERHLLDVLNHFGIERELVGNAQFKTQKYAKINQLGKEEKDLANQFMHWATHEHNVFSLGRFSTWRAGLLLDDLVTDIERIEGWFTSNSYQRKKELEYV